MQFRAFAIFAAVVVAVASTPAGFDSAEFELEARADEQGV